MIATSLSTRSCTTGLCGQCGPCRRALRADDIILRPKTLAPIELSPTVQQLLAEDRKRARNTRRPAPKVANRRKETGPYIRPTRAKTVAPPSPCTECGEMRGYRVQGGRGLGRALDGIGDLCTVCHEKPALQTIITTLEANPKRTKAEHSALSRSRIRLRRITKDGRPYHPEAPHGTGNAYTSYKCRCNQCCAWSTMANAARPDR
jgi:hypothetical protein